jgi:hypothetical protein
VVGVAPEEQALNASALAARSAVATRAKVRLRDGAGGRTSLIISDSCVGMIRPRLCGRH